MRLRLVLIGLGLLAQQAISQPRGPAPQNPAGFPMNLPPGWQAKKLNAGEVVATAPGAGEWVMIAPLLAQKDATTLPCDGI
jgi:hypothetical protein